MNSSSPSPASIYSFDSSLIDFTGGLAQLTPKNQTDSTGTSAGFGGGTSSGVQYDSTNSVLRLNTTTNNAALDSSWTPAWSSIVGYWPLDGSGTLSHGATIPATVGGAGTYNYVSGTAASFPEGKISQGISFPSGANENIGFPLTTTQTTNVTLSFWMNWNGTSASATVASNGSSSGYGIYLGDGAGGSGNVIGVALWGLSWSGISSNYSPAANVWTHLVLTSSGNVWTLYVNGTAHSSATITANTPDIKTYIGYQFPGIIDDFAIWNTALTPTQVASLYNRQSAAFSGSFTSRVMDALSTTSSWTSLSWIPTLPFFKELPDGGSSESSTNYSSQTDSLMSGIVGLWHLDEAAGTSARDRSGYSNHGTTSGGVTFGGGGILGTSAAFNRATNGFINVPDSGNYTLSSGYTLSMWIRLTDIPPTTENLMGQWGAGGVGNAAWAFRVTSTGYIGMANHDGVTTVSLDDTSALLTVGRWYHVTAVYTGGTTGTNANLYVNGKLVKSGTLAAIPQNSSYFLGIGAVQGMGANSYFFGSIDEVAIWNRPLGDGTNGSQNEILELYRRGANRIKYQIRSCSDSTCTTGSPSWQGPDNTNQTYFSEMNNNLIPSDGADLTLANTVLTGTPTMTFSNFGSLSVSTNRYFQYRAILESDDSNSLCNYGSGTNSAPCSPELKSVSVGPARATYYDQTSPAVGNISGANFRHLANLIETLGPNGCSDGIYYALSPNGTLWYYWTGTTWAISNSTYLQANQASTLTPAVLSSFSTQTSMGSLFFKAFLGSDGTHPCEIDNLTIVGY